MKQNYSCLALLSGGIDSAVAISFALQKKFAVQAIHFSQEKIVGRASIEKSIALCKKLGIKKLLAIDLSDAFAEIASECEHRNYFVLTKRLMFKIAEKIAQENKFNFLLTGESIAQVSSQTISNLSTITQAVSIPILRPLLCFDKQEIIDIAEKIGTFEISKGKEECDALAPEKHPATKTITERILEEEQKIELEKIIETALKKIVEIES